ncbi:MAG TPA: alkaline phosphatase family protein [Blastocatellia bacterium]|nr:alkaline phosphatase family protein [Blastocatellia bacterium]
MSNKTSLSQTGIEHVFVLVLENRSFDHMLGFSGLTGTNAVTGQQTRINGLNGTESNSYNGNTYEVSKGADNTMACGPGHGFLDVLEQLCGQGAAYKPGGSYPALNNSGFVANYAKNCAQAAPSEVMKCQTPSQIPILTLLAQNFAVCDNWFSSLPGPTWPNRFFVHAASSGGLDDGPSTKQILEWELWEGFAVENGTIFDSLKKAGHTYRIYSGGSFPPVAALKGIHQLDIRSFNDSFASDLQKGDYPAQYTFIEPCYGKYLEGSYLDGNSQHPVDGVDGGEQLIAHTYNAIRNSPIWEKSLLIVTYDEHGGFFDTVAPPPAIAPGDKPSGQYSIHGFTFEQYGPRVPAVIVSPLIPQNIIDHRVYDHASIPATIEAIFGLPHLTQRDANANNLTSLMSLEDPRQDVPLIEENELGSCPIFEETEELSYATLAATPLNSLRADDNLAGFLHVALLSDLDLSPASQRPAILAQFKSLKTCGDAWQYMQGVQKKVIAARAATVSKAG